MYYIKRGRGYCYSVEMSFLLLGQFWAYFSLGGAELEAPVVDALNVLLGLDVERRVDDGLFARRNDLVETHHILQLA